MNHPKVKRKLREIAYRNSDVDAEDDDSNNNGNRNSGDYHVSGDAGASQCAKRATVESVARYFNELSLPSSDGIDGDLDPFSGGGLDFLPFPAGSTDSSETMSFKRKKPLSPHHSSGDPRLPRASFAERSTSVAMLKRMRRQSGGELAAAQPSMSGLVLPENVWFLLSLFVGPTDMLSIRRVCRSTFAYVTDDCNWETLHSYLHGQEMSLLQSVLSKPKPIGLTSAFSSYSPRSVSASSSPSASSRPSATAERHQSPVPSQLSTDLPIRKMARLENGSPLPWATTSSSGGSVAASNDASATIDGSGFVASIGGGDASRDYDRKKDAAIARPQARRRAPRLTLVEMLKREQLVPDRRYCYEHRLIFHFFEANSAKRRVNQRSRETSSGSGGIDDLLGARHSDSPF